MPGPNGNVFPSYKAPNTNIIPSVLTGVLQTLIDDRNRQANDYRNVGSAGGGGGGGGPSYYDPGPYLPPINTGPSLEEIAAQWQGFDLNKESTGIADQRNKTDLENALAALGLSDTGARQQAAYQRGTLGLGLDQKLAELLSNATAAGAITSKGYGQNVGWANKQNQYDLTNVANNLQQTLAGNEIQRTQANQHGWYAGMENDLQRRLIDNSRLQYDAGVRSQANQQNQRTDQYNQQYNYIPYGQTRVPQEYAGQGGTL